MAGVVAVAAAVLLIVAAPADSNAPLAAASPPTTVADGPADFTDVRPLDGVPAGAVAPPSPGRYRVVTTTTGVGAQAGGTTTSTAEATLEVERVPSAPGETRVVETTSGRNDARDLLAWRPDGVRLLESNVGGGTCRFDPPLVTLPIPTMVNSSWHSDSRCTAGSRELRLQAQGRVAGTGALPVGGRRLPVYVVRTTWTISQRADQDGIFGDRKIDTTLVIQEVDLMSVDLGLSLRTRSVSTTTVRSEGLTRTVQQRRDTQLFPEKST